MKNLLKILCGMTIISSLMSCKIVSPNSDTEATGIDSEHPGHSFIRSLASSKVIQPKDFGMSDATPVEQWSLNNDKDQNWIITPGRYLTPFKSYHIIDRHSGLCLDLLGFHKENDAPVGLWTCKGFENQEWRIVPMGDGYQIQNVWNGKCLEVLHEQKGDGAVIGVWQCRTTQSQLWVFRQGYKPGDTENQAPPSPSTNQNRQPLHSNTLIGVHSIGPAYKFTGADPVAEGVKRIYDLGAKIIKLNSEDKYAVKYAFSLPFTHYFLWVRSNRYWLDGFSDQERQNEYNVIFNFAKQLLSNDALAGKTIFFGHWEGDWNLVPEGKANQEPNDTGVKGMAEWLNTRQQAIEDAKKAYPNSQVKIYQYVEVNRVWDAMFEGKRRLVNTVLPLVNVDYVSYSSYDTQQLDQQKINSVLDYIEGKMKYKAGFEGKRVFIGEFGISSTDKNIGTREEQDRRNREFIHKFASWGAPFILYWSMYESTTNHDTGRNFALIDDKEQKTPFYFTLQRFFRDEYAFIKSYETQQKKDPDFDSMKNFVADWFGK